MRAYGASPYFRRFATSLIQSVAGVSLGSVAPPDLRLLEIATLASVLWRGDAGSVQAYLPYLGYARQDKPRPGESEGIALIGVLLQAAGIDSLTTIDRHSPLDEQLLGIALQPLSPAPLFAAAVRQLGWRDVTVIAPDAGGIGRAGDLPASWGTAR